MAERQNTQTLEKMCGYEGGIQAGEVLEFGKLKLKNAEMMALLTHGFNDYTATGKKAALEEKIQSHVNSHGDEDPPTTPFFQEYHRQRETNKSSSPTNKRSSDGAATGLTPPPKKNTTKKN